MGTLPPPTGPATGPVATTQTTEGGKGEAKPSQQRLQLAINQISHQVDACGVWLPRQVNLDQGNQGWNLHGTATVHQDQREEILS